MGNQSRQRACVEQLVATLAALTRMSLLIGWQRIHTLSTLHAVVLAALACSAHPRVQLLGYTPEVINASFSPPEQVQRCQIPPIVVL